MVEERSDTLSLVFRALGDPTRRAMLRRLATSDRTVGELARPFRMSLTAASKHVKVLERAGLVQRTIRGRTHRCRLEAQKLATAQRWITFYERFWTERFSALDALLSRRASAAQRSSTRFSPGGGSDESHPEQRARR